jgi:hypothetical protein
VIEQNLLQNDIKAGHILRSSSIAKSPSGSVRAPYPCQPYLAGEVPESTRINAHLKATGCTPDEPQCASVVVEPEAVHLPKFKWPEKLDILAIHDIQAAYKAKRSKGFDPANCTTLAMAAITKIEQPKSAYLAWGAA